MIFITRGKMVCHCFLALFAGNRLAREPCSMEPYNTGLQSSNTDNDPGSKREKVCLEHESPPGVNYDENPSVFGRILNGELPAETLAESDELLAFVDRTPRAPLHALVIPKRYIPTVNDLTPEDIPLLQNMRAMGLYLIRQQYPDAYASHDYILCFHLPPFNSVDHLHLHVLAPASEIKFPYLWAFGKYQVGTLWCESDQTILEQLRKEKK